MTMERRGFMAAAALLGAAGPALAQGKPSLKGPYLDLTTGKGNMLAMVRMNGNLDETKLKYGGCSGIVSGVRPNEKIRDLFGFEVWSIGTTRKQPDGSYQILHNEAVYYTDLETGEILSEYTNPYTGEKVKVVDVVNDPWNLHYEEFEPLPPSYGGLNKLPEGPRKPYILDWREAAGGFVTAQRNINLFYPSALPPDKWPRESSGKMVQVSENYSFVVKLEDMQDQSKTSVEYVGSWSRVTPWLPWMLMGGSPGHVLYQSVSYNGDDINKLKQNVVEHTRKNHPQLMQPPGIESLKKPNLSSLENYARTQKPAPVPKS